MTPLIHDFIIENCNIKFIKANKRYFIRSYMKILLEDNSDASIKIIDFNNNDIYILDKNNSIFENINYNKSLYLKSDKDAVIYLFYPIKENSKIFLFEKSDNILMLSSSDCLNNKLKYFSDMGFYNYMPHNSDMEELEKSQAFISSFGNTHKKHKGTNYITYIECEQLIDNSSGFYENSTINEGSQFIEKDKNVYIRTSLDKDKKIFFIKL